ncbi:MAG: hypothetical protein HOI53_01545, partial [Francisellaceae bacterium]|nr:hypothetical protein [Francisellaceae bacterium]
MKPITPIAIAISLATFSLAGVNLAVAHNTSNNVTEIIELDYKNPDNWETSIGNDHLGPKKDVKDEKYPDQGDKTVKNGLVVFHLIGCEPCNATLKAITGVISEYPDFFNKLNIQPISLTLGNENTGTGGEFCTDYTCEEKVKELFDADRDTITVFPMVTYYSDKGVHDTKAFVSKNNALLNCGNLIRGGSDKVALKNAVCALNKFGHDGTADEYQTFLGDCKTDVTGDDFANCIPNSPTPP